MQRWSKMQFYLVCRTPWSAYIWYDKCADKKKRGKREKLRALGNFKNCAFRASVPLVRYFNFLLMPNLMIGLRCHCYFFIHWVFNILCGYKLTLWGTPILARPCLGEPWVCWPCFSFLWVFNPRNSLENVVFFLLVFCPCSVTTTKRNKLLKGKFSNQQWNIIWI